MKKSFFNWDTNEPLNQQSRYYAAIDMNNGKWETESVWAANSACSGQGSKFKGLRLKRKHFIN